MPLYNPPKTSGDKSPFWTFMEYVIRWMTSERVYIQGAHMVQKSDGKYFTIPNGGSGGSGQVIYMQACKADGSTCYVAIQVLAIVAGAGTGTVEATIPPGTVIPTGATVII